MDMATNPASSVLGRGEMELAEGCLCRKSVDAVNERLELMRGASIALTEYSSLPLNILALQN